MTHIPDLASVSYLGLSGPIRAVGWLESTHDFRRGAVDPDFRERLMALIARPISAYFHRGFYSCSLCAAEGRPGPDPRTSQAVLLVPASDCLYESPIWIGHYVSDHHYQPPEEFRRAVQSCATPGSEEFRSALAAHLPRLSQPSSLPFFSDWSEGARRTLLHDSERGSRRRFVEMLRRLRSR